MRIETAAFHAILAAGLLGLCTAQPLRGQIISDLRVNDEPDTLVFTARMPNLHVFSPDKFLVAWEDDRAGGYSGWAKFFDASMHGLTDDFPILGGENDNRVVFAVSDARPQGVGSDIFVSLYDLQALLTGVHARNDPGAQPRDFALVGLAPNPSRPGGVLWVDLTLDRAHGLELRLYNLLGQMVHQFAPQQLAAGAQEINLNLPRVAAGVYFLRAELAGRSVMRKLVVMH